MIKLSKTIIVFLLSFLCLFSNDKNESYHDEPALGFGMCEHGCGNKDHHLMPHGQEKLNENDFRFFTQINNSFLFIDLDVGLDQEVQNTYNSYSSFYLFGRPPPLLI
tara:strand:+ start:631 stop:951 length:321 start_codon:yes stop_codon:yes gene_type:complete